MVWKGTRLGGMEARNPGDYCSDLGESQGGGMERGDNELTAICVTYYLCFYPYSFFFSHS